MLMLSMGMNAQNANRDADTIRNESPKMLTGQHSPLVDYMYIADPTAIRWQAGQKHIPVYQVTCHHLYRRYGQLDLPRTLSSSLQNC